MAKGGRGLAMNTDIRISTGLLTNRKIKKLIRRKGYEGFYNLISLWINTGINCPEGELTGYDREDIMDMSGTNDENFIELLMELGLLEFDNENYLIHNWKTHNHWAANAKKRSEKARKAIEARWKNHKKGDVVNFNEKQ